MAKDPIYSRLANIFRNTWRFKKADELQRELVNSLFKVHAVRSGMILDSSIVDPNEYTQNVVLKQLDAMKPFYTKDTSVMQRKVIVFFKLKDWKKANHFWLGMATVSCSSEFPIRSKFSKMTSKSIYFFSFSVKTFLSWGKVLEQSNAHEVLPTFPVV